jgi:hypothetical protein
MSIPTHTVVCDFTGTFKVVALDTLGYKVKGTSENKATKLKDKYNA